MDDEEVGRYWDENAEAWTRLARAGFDVYRDVLNTPAFMAMLPDVRGKRGIDLGCGEGTNTRRVAERGATMTAIDVSERFLEAARATEAASPLGITFMRASALRLPFPAASFDFATAFMSLMDTPAPERAIAEAARVLEPGGFLQFSITHPCFRMTDDRWVEDAQGQRTGLVCRDYFDERERIDEWTFSAAGADAASERPFRTPCFPRTLSFWLNAVLDAGLTITRVGEPKPSPEVVARQPRLHTATVIAPFLHVQATK